MRSMRSYLRIRILVAKRLTALVATVILVAGSSWREAVSEERIFLRVTRLHGPEDTLVTLTADGLLVRHDGSHLVVRARGTIELKREVTATFFSMARSLEPPTHRTDRPVEGDLYFVQLDDRPPIATIDALASESLRMFVTDLLSLAQRVPMEPNRAHFLSSEPVTPERAARLESRDATAWRLEEVAGSTRTSLSLVLTKPYEPHPVPSTDFDFFEARFGGREGYVIDASGSWHQISLWSPP